MLTNARVLTLKDEKEARCLMEKMKVDKEGIEIMAPKTSHHLVFLEGVDARAANIIKQEMLSRGGEAALSWVVYTLRQGVKSDILLMGTHRQFNEFCKKLEKQPFKLSQVAAEIKEVLSNYTSSPKALKVGKFRLNLAKKTYIMGILNVTPDSFFNGGKFFDPSKAITHGLKMVKEGADVIDVGGESTRPGAKPIPLKEELKRVIPVIKELVKQVKVPISIDTYKAEVVHQALKAGATIVNDISALRMDKKMAPLIAKKGAPIILMHMKGTPHTMQKDPIYEKEVMGEITSFFRKRIEFAISAGIKPKNILIDPGIGFGKIRGHNLEIMERLSELKSLGYPIVLGTSRKSFIGLTLGLPVEERLEGTAATVTLGIAKGANILRVHDVKEMARVVRMTDAILKSVSSG